VSTPYTKSVILGDMSSGVDRTTAHELLEAVVNGEISHNGREATLAVAVLLMLALDDDFPQTMIDGEATLTAHDEHPVVEFSMKYGSLLSGIDHANANLSADQIGRFRITIEEITEQNND
jgi:hypothetical protein